MVKQIKQRASLPTAVIGSMEALLFCAAFVAGGLLLQGGEIASMILPMLAFVAVMMLSMIACGVYKAEVKGSALRLFRDNLMGFGIAAGSLSLVQMFVPGLDMSLEFLLFTVLASYFVVGTIRPMLSNMHGSSASDRRTA